MHKLRKAVFTAAAVMAMASVPAAGYAAEKINSVNVFLEADGYDDYGNPAISADTRNDHYSANTVYAANEYYESDSTYYDDPEIYVIELDAADGYYFNITKADKIRLNGLQAEFLKASRLNNGDNLFITVRLTGAGSIVGDIEDVRWTGNGHAEWSPAYGAKLYRLMLTGNDGQTGIYETCGTTYDFRPLMQKAGSYEFKVKPISYEGKSGEWTESGTTVVSAEDAQTYKNLYEVKKEIVRPDGATGPGSETIRYLNTGWQKTDDGRYWYRNPDASYPQSTWLSEDGVWYWLGKDGYMAVNEYIQYAGGDYYLGKDGKLVVNAAAPDGRKADENGRLSGTTKKES